MIWVEYDSDGRILRASSAEIVDSLESVVAVERASLPATAWRIVEGLTDADGVALPPTPVARDPVTIPEGAQSGGMTFAGLPAGTSVTVTGPLGGEADTQAGAVTAGQTLTVEAAAPGDYVISVDPPWPWMPVTRRVAISAGAAPTPGDVALVMIVPMARLIAEGLATIDATRAAIQAGIVSAGPAQPMVYLEKRRQAEELAAMASDAVRDAQVATDYPLVASEAEAAVVSISTAMRTILAKSRAWNIAARALDVLSLGAKRSCRAATTPAEVAAAVASLTLAAFLARFVADGGDPNDLE